MSGYDFSEGDSTVRKRVFSRHFIVKLIRLPRQTRDKHRENSKKDAFLQGCATWGPEGCEDEDEDCVLTQCTDRSSGAGKKPPFSRYIQMKTIISTKTGSGQA